MDGPRKATDVLLELETKINALLVVANNLDMNIKVISNKLNDLSAKAASMVAPPKFTVEAISNAQPATTTPSESDSEEFPEYKLPMTQKPSGFRRTSRPETFAGDDQYLTPPPSEVHPKFPVQLPKMEEKDAEVMLPPQAAKKPVDHANNLIKKAAQSTTNSVPVIQRVVDSSGKSVFLADVEIFSLDTKESVVKTRTNGVGKWMASLPVGEYQVLISKRESLSKPSIEIKQDIRVDGITSPLGLQTMIIKQV